MQREPLFSRDGFYRFVVRSNALLHRQAAAAAQRVVAAVLGCCGTTELRLLDLACGADPVIPAHVMGAFPGVAFHYHGIDINADQVAGARTYPFPANAATVRIDEGSTWNLEGPALWERYDLIFMGMNLHHGTPEEIHRLLQQLGALLAEHGIFFDHDWFRPEGEPYQRLPKTDPNASSAASPQRPAAPEFARSATEWSGSGDPPWRDRFCELIHHRLLEAGAEPAGAESTCRHIRARDFPVSLSEFERLCTGAGLHGRALRYGTDDPLMTYIAAAIAARRAGLLGQV